MSSFQGVVTFQERFYCSVSLSELALDGHLVSYDYSVFQMWALEYVSEEEILRLGTGRYGRGSPADSMLSETSGGVGGGVYENSGMCV